MHVNENILQSYKSERKRIVSTHESTLNHWIESFLKSISVWRQHETLAYHTPTFWCFLIGLNENANSLFPLGATFVAI